MDATHYDYQPVVTSVVRGNVFIYFYLFIFLFSIWRYLVHISALLTYIHYNLTWVAGIDGYCFSAAAHH